MNTALNMASRWPLAVTTLLMLHIVNKDGIDIFALSIMAEKQGKDKAIEPGEPCDLCLKSLVTSYHKLGRDRIIELVKQGKTEKEIKQIAKEKKKK